MQKARACRLGTPCVPRTQKQLLSCVVLHHPTLTAERIAEIGEVRIDRLYAFCSDNDTSRIPFEALVKIAAALDRWDLIDITLERYGRRVVALERTPAKDLLAEAMDVSVVHGDLIEAIRDASRDGQLSDLEKQAIRAQLRALRREMDDIDSVIDTAKARPA